MLFLLIAAVFIAVTNCAGTMMMAAMGWLFRVPIHRFSIGTGKVYFRGNLGNVPVRLGVFPFSSYVEFETIQNSAEKEGSDPIELRPGWQRFLIALSGPLVFFLLAFLLIPKQAPVEIPGGFIEFFKGAISPLSGAQVILQHHAGQIEELGWWPFGLGLLFSKAAAFQLLPTPAMGIFQAIAYGISPNWSMRYPVLNVITVFLSFALMAALISWVVALVRFCL